MTEQETLDVKNAIDGKLSDNLEELEAILVLLEMAKKAATDHGRFKRVDMAADKVKVKISRLKG
ncbi:hypothetical protein JHD50_08765 [Sulfurimonas sp. MAG313]|nr:hypothetical protein [Sulfurimonas sp. MAG313]MDF1881388.1 hypothetical protein [Sulfurimonas sp. MAG313]